MFSRFSLPFILMAVRLFPAHAQVQWDDVYNSCGPPANTAVGGAAIISDVVNMGKVSGAFMDKLVARQLDPWDNYRVAEMFDLVFDAKHPDAKNRWSTVRTNLQIMENIATTQKTVWVSCDDTTLFSVEEEDGTSRQFFTDPYSKVKIYTDTQTGTPFRQCADGVVVNGVTRYQLAYRLKINNHNLLVICSGHNEKRPLTFDKLTYGMGSDLYSLMTVSAIFFHEMSHVLIDSSRSEMMLKQDHANEMIVRGDVSGGVAAGGERYGWDGMLEVRSTYSTFNPDSLMLFAMALSMEEYLWNSGSAVTNQFQFAKLQLTPAGRLVIQNLGLTPS
jgi:hypothetical protein